MAIVYYNLPVGNRPIGITYVGPGFTTSSRFETEVSPKLFEGKTQWDVGKATPPLSEYAATTAACSYMNKLVHQNKFPSGVTVTSASWHPFNSSLGQYFWVVRFQSEESESEQMTSSISLVVLMDGMVVEPKITKREDLNEDAKTDSLAK